MPLLRTLNESAPSLGKAQGAVHLKSTTSLPPRTDSDDDLLHDRLARIKSR